MTKAHQPPHRNPKTGAELENKDQVCPSCFENFQTTQAGDAHRVGSFGIDRRCLPPQDVGLIPEINKYQTRIWRKND